MGLAFSPDYPGVAQSTTGYIEQAINPNGRGRVRYQATCWFAVCDNGRSLPKGTEVTVIGRRGNTPIVEPSLSH